MAMAVAFFDPCAALGKAPRADIRRTTGAVVSLRPVVSPAAKRPYAAWVVDAGGQNSGGQTVDENGLSDLVASAPEGERVVAITRLAVAPALGDVWRRCAHGEIGHDEPEVRPLTGPYVVPVGWDGPIGAPGYVAGRLRVSRDASTDDGRLVLAAWQVDDQHFPLFVEVVDACMAAGSIVTSARARTTLERLVAVEEIRDADGPSPRYAAALRALEQQVDDYEERFRDGDDFTWEQHVRIEQLLQELVLYKGAFPKLGMEAERLGLESRLVRLLNAQATRDASGALGRVISVLTALVLVPTLIAGVFGANVPLPFQETDAMRRAMFAFMACGGVLTYLLLVGVRQSSSSRRFVWSFPGAVGASSRESPAWLARRGFAALAGAALGIAGSALWQLWQAEAAGIRSSTTTVTTAGAFLALAGLVTALTVDDGRHRSVGHAAAVLAGAIVGALVAVSVLDSHLRLGVVTLVGLAGVTLVPRMRNVRKLMDGSNKALGRP